MPRLKESEHQIDCLEKMSIEHGRYAVLRTLNGFGCLHNTCVRSNKATFQHGWTKWSQSLTHEVYRQSAATYGMEVSFHRWCDHWWKICAPVVSPILMCTEQYQLNLTYFRQNRGSVHEFGKEMVVGIRRTWRECWELDMTKILCNHLWNSQGNFMKNGYTVQQGKCWKH